jgi:Secretion system C-terminal sorting domain
MKQSVLVIFLVCLCGALKAYSGLETGSDTGSYGQPLRLQNFRARIVSNNRVELSWLTAETWTTVTHYDIQRSLNNNDFTTAGSVQQTSSQPLDQQYAFTDNIANAGGVTTVYYRLRQVNRDGLVSFSHVIPVKLDMTGAGSLNIWPSPATDEVNLGFETPEQGLVTINIFDMSGRKVVEKQYNSGKGLNMIRMDEIKRLNAGVHIVQIRLGGVLVGTGKLLKQLK